MIVLCQPIFPMALRDALGRAVARCPGSVARSNQLGGECGLCAPAAEREVRCAALAAARPAAGVQRGARLRRFFCIGG